MNSFVFINMHMNRNGCRSNEKMTKKDKYIPEYPEFDYEWECKYYE